jgi:mannose-6-phosphate isomerase-like protein (cupin superfamily)
MTAVRNLDQTFASFDDIYEPRIVQQVNDYDVRIAKCEGKHTWHSHAETDEFFLVTAGQFTIHLRDADPIVLGPGDTYVVPKGIEHCPEAAPGTQIMMFEPQGTPSTGDQGPVAGLNSTTGITIDE